MVCMAGMAAATYPSTVLSASLPVVADDLGASDSTIQWVISAPFIAVAVATPLAGKLGDLFGHRRTYLAGFGGSTVLAILTATAWDSTSLIAFRTLAQATGAATGPAAMAIIVDLFSGPDRSKALGYWSAVTAASPMIGVVIGGLIVDAAGWQTVFVTQAALATIALVAAVRVLPAKAGRPGVRFDVPSSVLLGIGVAALLFAINRAPQWGWTDLRIVAFFAVAVIAFGSLGPSLSRAPAPLIPLEWFGRRELHMPVVVNLMIQTSYMGAFVVSPFLLDRTFGYGVVSIALAMGVRPLFFAIFAPAGGQLAARFGTSPVIITGLSLVIAASGLMALGSIATSLTSVIAGLAVAGMGFGLSRPALVSAVGDAVEDGAMGVASGTLLMIGLLGASIGIVTLTTVVGESTDPARFMWAYVIAAAVGLVGLAAALRLRVRD